MKVLEHTDITKPTKQSNAYELEKRIAIDNARLWEDVYESGLDKLSDFYGINMRELKRTIK